MTGCFAYWAGFRSTTQSGTADDVLNCRSCFALLAGCLGLWCPMTRHHAIRIAGMCLASWRRVQYDGKVICTRTSHSGPWEPWGPLGSPGAEGMCNWGHSCSTKVGSAYRGIPLRVTVRLALRQSILESLELVACLGQEAGPLHPIVQADSEGYESQQEADNSNNQHSNPRSCKPMPHSRVSRGPMDTQLLVPQWTHSCWSHNGHTVAGPTITIAGVKEDYGGRRTAGFVKRILWRKENSSFCKVRLHRGGTDSVHGESLSDEIIFLFEPLTLVYIHR
jgi:hypothetical protein